MSKVFPHLNHNGGFGGNFVSKNTELSEDVQNDNQMLVKCVIYTINIREESRTQYCAPSSHLS